MCKCSNSCSCNKDQTNNNLGFIVKKLFGIECSIKELQGRTKRELYFGVGIPVDSVGLPGDIYFDTNETTKSIYKKINKEWVQQVLLSSALPPNLQQVLENGSEATLTGMDAGLMVSLQELTEKLDLYSHFNFNQLEFAVHRREYNSETGINNSIDFSITSEGLKLYASTSGGSANEVNRIEFDAVKGLHLASYEKEKLKDLTLVPKKYVDDLISTVPKKEIIFADGDSPTLNIEWTEERRNKYKVGKIETWFVTDEENGTMVQTNQNPRMNFTGVFPDITVTSYDLDIAGPTLIIIS